MRRLFALAVVALLAMTVVLAAVGCGQKAQETTSTPETTPSSETMMSDTMMSDTGMTDTTMHQ